MSALSYTDRLEVPAAPPRERATAPTAGLLAALCLGAAPAIMLAIAAAHGGTRNSWFPPLVVLTFITNALIVAMDLRYGLALFIIGAALSPKLPGLYHNLRVEDFVFVLVFGAWVMRILWTGRMPAIRMPFLVPLLLLTLLSIGSTLYGFSLGLIPDWRYSLFLQLKRIEYFLIFLVVATSVRSEAWLRALCLLFVASGALAAVYGLVDQQSSFSQTIAEERVMGPKGENYNTLSGYLVLCISAGLALIPEFPRKLHRLLLVAGTAAAGAALLFSFSREGYVMLVGSLLVFGFTRHRVILLFALMALAAALLLAEPVRENLHHTVATVQEAPTADPGGNSLTARFRAWEYRWNGWFVKHPFAGNGVGAVALSVDNEYLLRLCEVGLVGFGIFIWWLAALGTHLRHLLRVPGLPHVLALGLGAGFVGLLIQGMAATSFTTIRTMEPFWFLLGLLYAALILRRQARGAPERAGAALPEPEPAPDAV